MTASFFYYGNENIGKWMNYKSLKKIITPSCCPVLIKFPSVKLVITFNAVMCIADKPNRQVDIINKKEIDKLKKQGYEFKIVNAPSQFDKYVVQSYEHIIEDQI